MVTETGSENPHGEKRTAIITQLKSFLPPRLSLVEMHRNLRGLLTVMPDGQSISWHVVGSGCVV